jgi:hypothetical protein
MPVIKCANGKYRIGTGACIYDTEDKANKIWTAILASGKYKADLNKVSYDYDDTLSTERGKKMAMADIKSGKIVYIITRRSRSQEVINVAKDLGIPESRVIFTSGALKWSAVSHYGIGTHYDNNAREIELINSRTDTKGMKFALDESYNDYPQEAVNNAKRALKYVEENGWGSCGEATGKARANQIANKENLTRDTIARMSAFKRHQQYKNVPYDKGCGGLMWDCWGGDAGIEWAAKKLKQIDNE